MDTKKLQIINKAYDDIKRIKDKLKSCPFCGGKAIVDTDDKFAWVHCVNCDSGTAGWRNRTLANKDSINTAIRIWNARPEEPRCDGCRHRECGECDLLSYHDYPLNEERYLYVEDDFYCKHFERKEDDE